MKKTILLVEDDHDLAELTSDYLIQNGYDVTIADEGLSAVNRIVDENPDLVILDLMLPNLSGLDVCKQVRQHYTNPILMFTAKNENIDEIISLELGADDYITKPVEPRLLLARVKALFRRALPANTDESDFDKIITVKGLVLNDGSRTVTLEGKEIILSNTEYELLWLLASNAGEILSRTYIFENLRGIDYDGANRTIDINISRLRSKLADNSSLPTIIKTIRNKGYLLSM